MNRRAFLALTPVAAVGGITTLLASPRAPQVQVIGSFTCPGNYPIPDAYLGYVDFAAKNMAVGSCMMIPAKGQAMAPPHVLQAAQAWGAQNAPQGFHTGQAKIIGLAGLIVCVIGICIMGFIFYWLWKWASTLLPPVDQQTNSSPNDPYPAARGAQ